MTSRSQDVDQGHHRVLELTGAGNAIAVRKIGKRLRMSERFGLLNATVSDSTCSIFSSKDSHD